MYTEHTLTGCLTLYISVINDCLRRTFSLNLCGLLVISFFFLLTFQWNNYLDQELFDTLWSSFFTKNEVTIDELAVFKVTQTTNICLS